MFALNQTNKLKFLSKHIPLSVWWPIIAFLCVGPVGKNGGGRCNVHGSSDKR